MLNFDNVLSEPVVIAILKDSLAGVLPTVPRRTELNGSMNGTICNHIFTYPY